MPFKRSYKRRSKGSTLTKSQRKEVKKIANKAIDEEIEDKAQVTGEENLQLYHNKPSYFDKFLVNVSQGVGTGDQGTGQSGIRAIRIGDQISLKNINLRFWLSNKLDRPNVMYRLILFWYPVTLALSDTVVFMTQKNKMLDRLNTKVIRVIKELHFKSSNNYAQPYQTQPEPVIIGPGILGKEASQFKIINKNYKNKKITYDDNGIQVKGWEMGMCVVCYDAFGTQQTDNISSFAYNRLITFQDA